MVRLRSGTKTSSLDMAVNGTLDEDSTESKPTLLSRLSQFTVNPVIATVHFGIFLYATCFFIQNSTLPYLTKKLGVDPVMFGYLETTFALFQLAGGPLFGRYGDVFGSGSALTLAFAASALTYGLLGVSYNIPMLFVSRLPSIFMHAMQASQMVVTDIWAKETRADALGKLGVSYGAGVIVGPFVGGLITSYAGEQAAALVAASISVLSIFISLFMVPRKNKHHVPETKAKTSAKSIVDFSKWKTIISRPGALLLLGVKTVIGFPLGAFQAMFSLIAMNTFNLEPHQNGYVMSYIGVLMLLVQGFGIGFLIKRYSENKLILWSNFVLIWAWLAQAYVTSIAQWCVITIPKVVGIAVQQTVISSALTKTVPDTDTGAMLGLNMAIHSIVRSVSPTLGGYLLQNYGFAAFGYFGFVVSTIVFIFLWFRLED